MTRAHPPMPALDRLLGGRPPGRPEDAELLREGLQRLGPDPLYQRRLRSAVLNYYVASREGLLRPARRQRRQMGVIGRAVLYASLALTLSVSAVGAAAQDSLPGDALYGVKLRLEEIRLQIAPPSVRGQLAEMALAERIDELQQLAAVGAWAEVPAAAERLAVAEVAAAQLEPVSADAAPGTAKAIEVLQTVLAKAPEAAREGLERAIAASSRGNQGAAPIEPPGLANGSPHPSPRANGMQTAPGRQDGGNQGGSPDGGPSAD